MPTQQLVSLEKIIVQPPYGHRWKSFREKLYEELTLRQRKQVETAGGQKNTLAIVPWNHSLYHGRQEIDGSLTLFIAIPEYIFHLFEYKTRVLVSQASDATLPTQGQNIHMSVPKDEWRHISYLTLVR